MFALEPNPTPLDWTFHLFGIPVRVNPWFWLVTIMLGWGLAQEGIQFLLLWTLCVFVSILIHELGHVLVGQLFGTHGHIVLYSFGGLAVGSSALRNRWQRIAVYFAGPLADFIFFGLVYVGQRFLDPHGSSDMLTVAVSFLFWINLVWGVVNLLPIFPLDGGQISRDILEWFLPRKGILVSLGLSGVVSVLFAILVYWWMRDLWMVFFFGMLAFNSFFALHQLRQALGSRDRYESYESDRAPWERDPDYWKK